VRAQTGHQAGAISDMPNILILTSSLLTIILTLGAFWPAPPINEACEHVPLVGSLGAAAARIMAEEGMLRDHTVVVGYGQVGWDVVAGLCEMGVPVVIDQDRRLVQDLGARGFPAIYGDALYASVVASARIARAGWWWWVLPAAVPTRTAVHERPRAHVSVPILVRSTHPEHEQMLRRLSATTIVAPEQADAAILVSLRSSSPCLTASRRNS
jgi:hypothetical protein